MAAATHNKIPGVLHLEVVRAKGLAAKDFNGKSDPYAKVGFVNAAGKWVGQHESVANGNIDWAQSEIIKEELNPVWNYKTTWHLSASDATQLKIELWDWDRASSDDFLGEVFVPISEITEHDDNRPPVEKTLPVQHKPGKEKEKITGDVTFTIQYYGDERKAANEAAERAERERIRKEEEERKRKEEEERKRKEEEARLAELARVQEDYPAFFAAEGARRENASDRLLAFSKFPELLDRIVLTDDKASVILASLLLDGEGNQNVFQTVDGVSKWITIIDRLVARYFPPAANQTEATKAGAEKLTSNKPNLFKFFWSPISNTAAKRAQANKMHTAEILRITENVLNVPDLLKLTFEDNGFAFMETLVLDVSLSSDDALLQRAMSTLAKLLKALDTSFKFDSFFYHIRDVAVEALRGVQSQRLPEWSFVPAFAHNTYLTYHVAATVRKHGTPAQRTAFFKESLKNKLNTVFCGASGLTLLPQLAQPKEAGPFSIHERLYWGLMAFQNEQAGEHKAGASYLELEVLCPAELKFFEIMMQWRAPGGTRVPSRSPSFDELKGEKARQVMEAAMGALSRVY